MKITLSETAYIRPGFELQVIDGLQSVCNVSTNESTLDGVSYEDYGEL